MEEIAPGLWFWPSTHPRHGIRISSYYCADSGVVIDPMVPAEGLDWFRHRTPPSAVLLSNRHHLRDAGAFREAFGARVLCNRLGAMEFGDGDGVEFFDAGDELPGGVVAHPVGAICPDETALHLRAHRALAVADGVVRIPHDGPLGFVPDALMGDPQRTKAGLAGSYVRLAELDFDHLLLAHGDPVVGGAAAALGEFATMAALQVVDSQAG
ncbi:MAG: hypothetical protein RIB67_03820 [Miltoncostaeaceae bacterium]